MNWKPYLLTILSLCLLLCGCKMRSNQNDEENKNYDYPVTVIKDTISINVLDKTELYPMSEEFMESFMEKAGTYEGHHSVHDTAGA